MPTRFLSVLLVSGALVAQSVSPLHFTTAEGASNNVYPFGNTTVPFRYSQIHDDVPGPAAIFGMSFRHNATSAIYAAHSLTMDAWVSTALNTSATMSTTFDNNHGGDKAQVVTNRTYVLPASNPFNVPGQFVLDFPFDFPFVFLGGGASLCWEVQITAKTQTGSIIYDFVSSAATSTTSPPSNPAMALARVGLGCIATGRTAVMGATPGSTMSWPNLTGIMTINGVNLEANGLVFFVIGMNNTIWNNIPLPAVIPTSTGAPSGTCNVYADNMAAVLAFASAAGTASLSININADPAYNGLTFYSQVWGFDLAANPFGVTTSNVAIHNVVAPFNVPMPVSRVFLLSSLGPTGSLGAGDGLVTRFY